MPAALSLVGIAPPSHVQGRLWHKKPYKIKSLVGERARPVLPAIHRSAREDHRQLRAAALYLVRLLDGTCGPHDLAVQKSGKVLVDPEQESHPQFRWYA